MLLKGVMYILLLCSEMNSYMQWWRINVVSLHPPLLFCCYFILFLCYELRMKEVTEVALRCIYGFWICTIVTLIWSNASSDPQSGIIEHCTSQPHDFAEFTLLWERWGQNLRITKLHLKINVEGKSLPYQHLYFSTLNKWSTCVCSLSRGKDVFKKWGWPFALALNLPLGALRYTYSRVML